MASQLGLDLVAKTGGDLPHNGAVISLDERYRYVLTRTWDPSLPRLAWCMLNPSTADASLDDPTIRKCKGFARRVGHGGITVVNLFAFRTVSPAVLKASSKTVDIVGPENDTWIRRVFSEGTKTIVCGWGGNVPNIHRAGRIRQIAAEVGAILYCFGISERNGAPRHPLYTPYETPMTEWRTDVEEA